MSIFNDRTYETLIESALTKVNTTLDKREGSLVYNGIAPAMAELAQLYIGLDFVFNATYISTAPREYLIKRAMDKGLSPKPASCAVFRGDFNTQIPNGSRFSCEDLNFTATERIDSNNGLISYKLVCDTAGSVANSYSGALIPIDYIDGLTSANLTELLIPGDDEEDTEVFRQRVLNTLQNQVFGGNQYDYKQKVSQIDGVGAVKVYPIWNLDISPSELIPNKDVQNWFESSLNDVTNTSAKEWITSVYNAAINKKLTVGGTVRLVIMAANGLVPSSELLDLVQSIIDPTDNTGEGLGFAPIGHVVKIDGVTPFQIDIKTNLVFSEGWNRDNIIPYVKQAIENYFKELSDAWENTDNIIIRISQLESRILQDCASMIVDISDTKINGNEGNLVLSEDSIPYLRVVTVNG